MGQDQFAAIMPYISTDLVGMIAKKNKISENDAITKLYNSKLYAILEQEETKVWQYSTEMLEVNRVIIEASMLDRFGLSSSFV